MALTVSITSIQRTEPVGQSYPMSYPALFHDETRLFLVEIIKVDNIFETFYIATAFISETQEPLL
jgi:hypothetical protein